MAQTGRPHGPRDLPSTRGPFFAAAYRTPAWVIELLDEDRSPGTIDALFLISKTCGGVLRTGLAMKYPVIQQYDRRYPIR